MKKHFGREIIERPRRGSRTAKSAKARDYGKLIISDEGPDYDGLLHLPVSRKQEGYNKKLGDKSFSDLLGPLHKFLRSNCGRQWDDVYSELAVLGRHGSPGINHILEAHLDVETNTYRGPDGGVYAVTDYGGEIRVDIRYHIWRGEFYVEPETGILRESKAAPKQPRKEAPLTEIPIEPGKRYIRIEGVWYFQEYTETEERVFAGIVRGIRRYRDETRLTITVKRQLSKKELKSLHKLYNI